MMYSVIRFTSNSLPREVHEDIGYKVGILVPGAYRGLRRAGDGFACELSSANRWEEHRTAILAFIHSGRSAISRAREQSIDVCVDVAIEPEDLAGTNVFSIHAESDFIKRLVEADVSLELSVYGGAPAGSYQAT